MFEGIHLDNFVGRLFRFVLKLVLAAFAIVFALSVLAAALIVMILSVFKSILTGKKPTPTVVFSRFQKFSPGGVWPGAARETQASNTKASDVVDVEVREVRDEKRLP